MIRKAVITAAGKGTRQYPATNTVQKELFPLIDVDGIAKPTIQIIAEQALEAGIKEICIVTQPDMQARFQEHFQGIPEKEKPVYQSKPFVLKQSDILKRLHEVIHYELQTTQEGFGHAVHCAAEWVGDEPFLLLLGDHVYVSDEADSCISQTLNAYKNIQKTLFPVKQTPVDQLHLFGTVAGSRLPDSPDLYKVEQLFEKPDIGYARLHLQTPGLPEDMFFTFFGMYALTPSLMQILRRHVRGDLRSKGEIQLTTALHELIETDGAYALEIKGDRLDMGTPFGYIETQIALARRGNYRKQLNI